MSDLNDTGNSGRTMDVECAPGGLQLEPIDLQGNILLKDSFHLQNVVQFFKSLSGHVPELERICQRNGGDVSVRTDFFDHGEVQVPPASAE